MLEKQEYEGGWCGYKFCFTNKHWMPKTTTDAILDNPCIAPASARRNAATLRLALKYALTEHFNNHLVHLKTTATEQSWKWHSSSSGAPSSWTWLRLRLQLRSSWFLWVCSGALGFHESLFHGSGSSSGFCSFSQINIFDCLGVPQVKWKMSDIKYTKLREYIKLFWVLVVFYKQCSCHKKINEKNYNHRFRRFKEELLAET